MTDEQTEQAGVEPGPVETAREIHDLVEQILERLNTASAYGKRTRRLTIGLAVSVALDIAVSLILGLVLIHERANTAAIHASQIRACHIGNDGRAAQRRLWEKVFQLSAASPRNETAAQRKKRLDQLHQFRVFINHEFRSVDCQALYRQHPAADPLRQG